MFQIACMHFDMFIHVLCVFLLCCLRLLTCVELVFVWLSVFVLWLVVVVCVWGVLVACFWKCFDVSGPGRVCVCVCVSVCVCVYCFRCTQCVCVCVRVCVCVCVCEKELSTPSFGKDWAKIPFGAPKGILYKGHTGAGEVFSTSRLQ